MTASLDSQVALVTGATRGIGKAIALRLAADGATVVGTATTDEGARSVAAMLEAAGGRGTGMRLDVNDPAQVDSVLAAIANEFGPVVILVNNAGVTRDNLLLRMKDEEWNTIVETNLTSVYRLSKAVLRGMMRAPRAHRQYRQRRGRERQCRPVELRRREGRGRRVHEVARAGGGKPQRHRQLRGARLHRHRHDP